MANNYVINALWNAAADAVNHKDIEALQDVINELKAKESNIVETPINITDRWESFSYNDDAKSMSYLDIVSKLDEKDFFRKFFEFIGNKEFRPIDFTNWMKQIPEIEWMTKTHNFQSQLVNVFYSSAVSNPKLSGHPYLKYLKRGSKNGFYLYSKKQVVTQLFA